MHDMSGDYTSLHRVLDDMPDMRFITNILFYFILFYFFYNYLAKFYDIIICFL